MLQIQIRTCLLFVNEIKKSRDFYQNFFQIKPVEDLPDFASFQFGAIFFNLHLADEALSPVSTGGTVVYFCVQKIDEWIERALSLGAEIWRGPITIEEGWTLIQLKDPFGNVIGLESST